MITTVKQTEDRIMNTHSIKKSNGKMKGERIRVKTFKDSELMHGFLNKQYDNNWQVHTQSGVFDSLPHKNGLYAYAGGQWHNVKSLDACVLAHI
tara:strand:+ start:263 stop:544 length:282 start_codon:yes stop_codon:yes gene_type:complete